MDILEPGGNTIRLNKDEVEMILAALRLLDDEGMVVDVDRWQLLVDLFATMKEYHNVKGEGNGNEESSNG